MRIDSCRKCGNELEINQRCDVCNDAIEFYCHGCGATTEKQIHRQCMINSDQIIKVKSN
jgi:hypothetical protein